MSTTYHIIFEVDITFKIIFILRMSGGIEIELGLENLCGFIW